MQKIATLGESIPVVAIIFSSGLGAINRATRNYYFSEQQIISRDGLSRVQNVHYL